MKNFNQEFNFGIKDVLKNEVSNILYLFKVVIYLKVNGTNFTELLINELQVKFESIIVIINSEEKIK